MTPANDGSKRGVVRLHLSDRNPTGNQEAIAATAKACPIDRDLDVIVPAITPIQSLQATVSETEHLESRLRETVGQELDKQNERLTSQSVGNPYSGSGEDQAGQSDYDLAEARANKIVDARNELRKKLMSIVFEVASKEFIKIMLVKVQEQWPVWIGFFSRCHDRITTAILVDACVGPVHRETV